MSRLRIFCPEEANSLPGSIGDNQPSVSQFASLAIRFQGRRMQDAVDRARLIHANRRCPFCQHSSVGLIQLQDAILNRNRMPIPGTATLVGFHCDCCGKEWPSSLPVCEPPITSRHL